MKHKYHYFYRITNLITEQYYYGIHSTDNLNDKYMGSGHRLVEAFKIYGKDNFVKEILKFFETRELASMYEESVVTEKLVQDNNCYNIKIGGDYGLTLGTILVTDRNGKMTRCTPDDPRYLNGELKPFSTGKISVYDIEENRYHLVPKEEVEKNSERYIKTTQGRVTVVDKNGKYMCVSVDDPRYLNGELKPTWCGRKHREETKEKMRNTHIKNKHQQGEKNSQYGTCWVTKNNESIKIKKEKLDKYINDGWKKGRKLKNIVYPSDNIDVDVINDYRNDGLTWEEISNKVGISRSTLMYYRKRHNL